MQQYDIDSMIKEVTSDWEELGGGEVHLGGNKNIILGRPDLDSPSNFGWMGGSPHITHAFGLMVDCDEVNILGRVTSTVTVIKADIDSLGVEDIFNLKEHEYGLLKLKFELTKFDLYVPSFMVPDARRVWNEC